eukprot:4013011-Prorocentrum_lima.AAC.1
MCDSSHANIEQQTRIVEAVQNVATVCQRCLGHPSTELYMGQRTCATAANQSGMLSDEPS